MNHYPSIHFHSKNSCTSFLLRKKEGKNNILTIDWGINQLVSGQSAKRGQNKNSTSKNKTKVVCGNL